VRYSYETTKLDARSGFNDQLGLVSLSDTRIIQITPSFQYDSRNNYYVPSEGFYFLAMMPVSHWSFGSDVSYYKLYTKATKFWPSFKKTFFAANAEFGWVRPFGEHRTPASERFFLGGSNSVRGYGTRAIGPSFEGLVYGGDTYVAFNAEYTIPAGDTFQFVFFADAGEAYALDAIRTVYQGNIVTLEKGFDAELKTSAGFEVRFFVPMFPYPVRLIWSRPFNPEPWQPTKTFEFNIGPTF
jgi:outer membrane protein insertion porin family